MVCSPSEPIIEVFGLVSDSMHFAVRPASHRHNEIELIFVKGSGLTFLFGGHKHQLQPGQCAVFWAVVPHQVLESDEGAVLCWMKVPLGQFLEWQMLDDFLQVILCGKFLLDTGLRPAEVSSAQFQMWHDYLAVGSPEGKKIVLLEVEARLREFAWNMRVGSSDKGLMVGVPKNQAEIGGADRMISYIAAHFQDQVTVSDVAAAAELQPGYAMRVFRARFGMSIVSCINQMRISQAQRLLVTSEASVLEVLLESGFGSVTQFYTTFKRYCGCAPMEYRLTTHRRR